MMLIAGTAIARSGRALLLRGPSGAGKSALALSAIGQGWALVADDMVEITPASDALPDGPFVRPPQRLAGMLEVRGLGLVRLPWRAGARLAGVVDLLPHDEIERLPPRGESESLGGRALPLHRIDPHGPSAVDRLDMILKRRRVA